MPKYFIIFILLMSLAACKDKPELPTGHVIAQVNKHVLTMEKLRSYYAPSAWDTLSTRDKRIQVNKWIDLHLLVDKAEEAGLTLLPQMQTKIANAQLKITANAYLATQLDKHKISEADMFNYYRIHKSKYKKQATQYKVQQILVKNKNKMEKVLSEINNGFEFTAAAQKYSTHKSGPGGGYIGFVGPADLDNERYNKLKSMEKYVFGTIQTKRGWWILRYYNTQEIEVEKTFEEVKDFVKKQLRAEKLKTFYDDNLKQLRSTADINISI